jgi:hypothetical protein
MSNNFKATYSSMNVVVSVVVVAVVVPVLEVIVS